MPSIELVNTDVLLRRNNGGPSAQRAEGPRQELNHATRLEFSLGNPRALVLPTFKAG